MITNWERNAPKRQKTVPIKFLNFYAFMVKNRVNLGEGRGGGGVVAGVETI